MHKIYEANDDFPKDNLVLTTPIIISSGVYFIKYLLESEALYVQTPKCITRQGIIKGGRKMYCDLLLTNENNSFIKWVEDLEGYSQSYIFKNRERWYIIEYLCVYNYVSISQSILLWSIRCLSKIISSKFYYNVYYTDISILL